MHYCDDENDDDGLHGFILRIVWWVNFRGSKGGFCDDDFKQSCSHIFHSCVNDGYAFIMRICLNLCDGDGGDDVHDFFVKEYNYRLEWELELYQEFHDCYYYQNQHHSL